MGRSQIPSGLTWDALQENIERSFGAIIKEVDRFMASLRSGSPFQSFHSSEEGDSQVVN
jgi:hypothetical protein